MKPRIIFASLLGLCGLVAMIAFPWAIEGQSGNRRKACSGLITKTSGQTIRMTALNTGNTTLQIKPTFDGYVVQSGPNAGLFKAIQDNQVPFNVVSLEPGNGTFMDYTDDVAVVSGTFEWRESSSVSGLKINTQVIDAATGEVLSLFGSDACKNTD